MTTVLLGLLLLASSATASSPGRAAPAAAAPPGETLTFGRFGQVTLYRPAGEPRHVVLFFSGDGGWNRGVTEMARILAGMDSLVVGIDLPRYFKQLAATAEKCSYPAADLELLSKTVQRKLGLPRYLPPVLVGYSSGATLVYAALVQAPPGTFRGAISLGFCPDLPLKHPLCQGHGLASEPGPRGKGFNFLPAPGLESPWIAFQGEVDQVCSKDFAVGYTGKIPSARLVLLPKVGHGFGVESRWVPQFKDSFERLVRDDRDGGPAAPAAGSATAAPSPASPVGDLPLVEVPARGREGDSLAVVLSGDGGWAGIDREIALVLASKGVPVVGFNSLQYFWTGRTPDGTARDLARILRHYLAAWNRRDALLVGYSLGADILPFLAARLPADLLGRVRLIALLGPSREASFQFHLSDWLGVGGERGLPVLPEVRKLAGHPLLCLYGREEHDSLCPEIGPALGKSVALPGAHHFGGDYDALAALILRGAAG